MVRRITLNRNYQEYPKPPNPHPSTLPLSVNINQMSMKGTSSFFKLKLLLQTQCQMSTFMSTADVHFASHRDVLSYFLIDVENHKVRGNLKNLRNYIYLI